MEWNDYPFRALDPPVSNTLNPKPYTPRSFLTGSPAHRFTHFFFRDTATTATAATMTMMATTSAIGGDPPTDDE
jgi:hypothetical protein